MSPLSAILLIYEWGIPLALAVCIVGTSVRLLACVFFRAPLSVILRALRSLGAGVISSAMPLSFTLTASAYLPIEAGRYQLPGLMVLATVLCLGLLAVVLDTVSFLSDVQKRSRNVS